MRARNLKPGFFQNDTLCECKPLARILFEGLWCLADREGRFEWKPKKIKAMILPYDKCSIELLLNEIAQAGFILFYEVNGNKYGFIPTFLEHQSPHPKEKRSNIPEPSEDIREFQGISGNFREFRTSRVNISEEEYPDSEDPDSDKRGSGGKEKKGYAEFVLMTENQYEQLLKKHGKELTEKMIEELNNYKGSFGKKYKSDYHAILSWVTKKILSEEFLNDRTRTTTSKRPINGKTQKPAPYSDRQPYPVDYVITPDDEES